MFHSPKLPTLLLPLALLIANSSFAVAAPIAGNGGLGDFTGDFSYDQGTRTVSVSLTNSATTLPGGKLVAFAFNLPVPAGTVGSVTYGNGGTSLTLLGAPSFNNSVSVSPWGSADIGAAIGGSWLGGGNPNPGLAVGQSATWTFLLNGVDAAADALLSTLTAQQIYNTTTTGSDFGFVVRFRGFDNGGSDKVPGGVFNDPVGPLDPTGDPTFPVPEPTTLLVFGIMTGCGALGYRVRRKHASAM